MSNNSRKVKLVLGKQPGSTVSTSTASSGPSMMHLWKASSKVLAALDRQEQEESSAESQENDSGGAEEVDFDHNPDDTGVSVQTRNSPVRHDNLPNKTCKGAYIS